MNKIMNKYFFTLCFLVVVSTVSGQETRTENNGNLILEDIPAIPGSIKEDLSKYEPFFKPKRIVSS